MKKQSKRNRKPVSTRERVLRIFTILLIIGNVFMALNFITALMEEERRSSSTTYRLMMPDHPAAIASAYIDEGGPYASDRQNAEAHAYARYIDAALFYYAYRDAGDATRAALYRERMEENADGFPAEYLQYIRE